MTRASGGKIELPEKFNLAERLPKRIVHAYDVDVNSIEDIYEISREVNDEKIIIDPKCHTIEIYDDYID